MLAEFKYGLEPKETFAAQFDQAKSNRCVFSLIACRTFLTSCLRLFYHFKKVSSSFPSFELI